MSEPIIVREIVSGMLASMPRPKPSTVYVLSYSGGDLRLFVRAPTMADRLSSKYCYLVDVSERHSYGRIQIPSRGDVYYFQVDFEASWYVSDPLAVVRRDADHGDPLITNFLQNAMWRIGRAHGPSDAQGAEDDILASLQTPWNTGVGLTLTAVTARVVLDQRQSGAVAEIDSDNLTGRLEEQRVRRLRERLDGGDHAFVLEHLAQHPGDTGSILQMLSATKERNEQTRLALFDRLVAAGFVQDADIGSLRDVVLGGPSVTALQSGTDYRQAPNTITPIAPGAAAPSRSIAPPASPQPSWPAPDTTYQPDTGSAVAEDQAPTAPRGGTDPPSDNVATWKPIRKRPRGAE